MRSASMLFALLLAQMAPAAAPARPLPDEAPAGPAAAVAAMFDAFTRGSAEGFTACMTPDFRFTSADPAFEAMFPTGMTRDDEHAFVNRLFGDPPAGPPRVLTVIMAMGSMVTLDTGAGAARVVLERPHVRLAMSDGSQINLFGASQAFDVVLLDGVWRVSAWREGPSVPAEPPLAADADTTTRIRVPAPELVLALVPRVDGRAGQLEFEVVLPRPGGRLDMYDVSGRRVAHRDLSDLPRGRHRIALDPRGRAPGMYWARVRQGGESVTARIAWLR